MNTLKTAKGFTLIELLVVVAIIGILAAIAIPAFSQYRMKGFDAQIQADARNGATAEEAYYVTSQAYLNYGDCSQLPGMSVSAGDSCSLGYSSFSLNVSFAPEGNSGYSISTWNPNASFQGGCYYDSAGSPNLTCFTGVGIIA